METTIIVRVLADTDAVWLPLRSWHALRPANVYCGRVGFANGGVPWESGEPTEAGRKAAQRAIEEMAFAGQVYVCKPHRVRTLGVRLSDEAEARARALVGLPGLYAGWVSAQEVAKHSRRPPTLLADLWVSERKLIGECGPDAYRRETALVETMLLPALIRGYVESNADVQGRVSYMLTPGGWTWLAAGNAPPDDDLGGEPDPDVAALYRERLKASFARLDTVEPQEPREIGYIPLPVAIGGLKLTEAERG